MFSTCSHTDMANTKGGGVEVSIGSTATFSCAGAECSPNKLQGRAVTCTARYVPDPMRQTISREISRAFPHVAPAQPREACEVRVSCRSLMIAGRLPDSSRSVVASWAMAHRDVLTVEVTDESGAVQARASSDEVHKAKEGAQWRCAWEGGDSTLFNLFTDSALLVKVSHSTKDRFDRSTPAQLVGEVRLLVAHDLMPAVCLTPEPTFPLIHENSPAGNVQLSVQVSTKARRPSESAESSALSEFVQASRWQQRRWFVGHKEAVHAVAAFPQADRVLTVSADKMGAVWNPSSGEEHFRLEGHKMAVRCCDIFPSGDKVITGSEDKTAIIWDVLWAGRKLHVLEGHSGAVLGCAVFPENDRKVVDFSYSYAEQLKKSIVLEIEDRRQNCSMSEVEWYAGLTVKDQEGKDLDWLSLVPDMHKEDLEEYQQRFPLSVKFARVDRVLTVSVDKIGIIWNAATGKEMFRLVGHTDEVNACAIFKAGDRILTVSDDTRGIIWDANTGAQLLELAGHSKWLTGCAIFSSDARVVTVSTDRTGIIWDANTGEQLIQLVGHAGGVYGASVFRGDQVLTVSSDKKCFLWQAGSWVCVREFSGHRDWVRGCTILPSGDTFITVSDDGRAIVWQRSDA